MIHMVTGGSGSGKSAYAEGWITRHARDHEGFDQECCRHEEDKKCVPLLYVATMRPFTQETRKKIARHQSMRAGKGFITLECYRGLKNLEIPKNRGILLECISNLAANELYGEDGKMKDWRETLEVITEGIRHLSQQTDCMVIVTNEVNSDINGYSEETDCYRKLLGAVNQEIAKIADRVTEVVYGIPVTIKDVEEVME